MYYPSYSHGVYPYNAYPYHAYPMPNGYDFYSVSNQAQYKLPERKKTTAQKEATPEKVVITNGELISKEEPTFGELISKEGSPLKEESTSKKSNTFTKRLLNHLNQRKGKNISVATPIKEIQGKLEEVFPDYILVNMDGQHYHIRWEGIVYIS
ncbi:Protein of unknown function [Aneurinibacillus thermoaerophilus]|uniref:YuzF family protein n=1 Tax=Aneurinibacillus thermoaerophilus TaxID=143495 RepID=A0A1G7YFJ5_ANETH|nr:DUF2642 domain-containing protein [Aneurinibacillus thermoaerophilus]MED0677552.1 DUF2642 domain-containing protein [Aneurinibacillus thermoaerophilus]MED0681011.1 DUF2642 domain-containing protein [Aneurinibacillus thermoaerophilus]MED0765703.1 DUF2642 domain-containing protein [Aneurinibacillus thermoaerophilus]QYY41990.1 YuzF family protein [Aneurinibacillus thermoaerophilus]SDG95332.1 Protein of unknown function [Aneurinibacillus thermoaerophilus]